MKENVSGCFFSEHSVDKRPYIYTLCPEKNARNRMLIKVSHQEKGSRKLLAEFPSKAFELIPTVFIVLETCVFRVSS